MLIIAHKQRRGRLVGVTRARPCRLRNACKDNLSCLTGKANKRHVPSFRDFMQPVITEMDPEECVEEPYKVLRSFLDSLSRCCHLSSVRHGHLVSLCQNAGPV